MRKLLTFSLLIILLLAGIMPGALAQEDTDTDDEMDMVETAIEDAAFVRFAHLAPDAGTVDIYINGEPSGLVAFGYPMITPWFRVPAGTHTVTVVAEGDPIDLILTQEDVALAVGTFNNLLVTGLVDETGTAAIDLNPVMGDFSEMLPGTANITFLNALSDYGIVNFDRDGTPFVTDLGAVGNADGLDAYVSIPVDSALYDFTIYPTGAPENVIATLEDAELRDSSVYLMALVGTTAENTVLLYETTPAEIALLRGDLLNPGTLVQTAESYEILAPFATAIETADLTDILSGLIADQGPFTLFVPADYVMDPFLQAFDGTPDELASILANHAVRGDYRFSELEPGMELVTVSGEILVVGLNEDAKTVNGVDIVVTNLPATNGVVHVISDVLTYEEMVEGDVDTDDDMDDAGTLETDDDVTEGDEEDTDGDN